jgi:hypothetical protein
MEVSGQLHNPAALPLGERAPSTHLIGGWAGPRASLDNIRMQLMEIGWEGVNWIEVAQNRDQWWAIVNAVVNLWVP